MGVQVARCVVAAVLATGTCGISEAAQQAVASATVGGRVEDASGAVLQGATVRIANIERGQEWSTSTGPQGRFQFLYLPPGPYRLTVVVPDFEPREMTLTLSLGAALEVPIKLELAAVTDRIDVAAPAPLIEARRTQVAATIGPQEIDTLPLNGRNYLDLALLVPSVSRTNLRSTDRFAETSAVPGTGISVSGQRNLSNTFVVDGLSANDGAADLAGTFFSQEVVREFQVVTSGGMAEFGRASAGVVSVVTQSGTNKTQGRAYEFFRDDRFDARNPLSTRKDPVTLEPLKDPLRQNQFGFSVGGPIRKSRTFWFANVERTQLDRTGIVTIAPSAVSAVNNVLDMTGYRGPRITTGNYPTGYDTTNAFGRIDHLITVNSRLQFRYSLYDVDSLNARNVGSLNDVSRGAGLRNTDQTAAVNHLWVLSSGAINEARAQYTRNHLGAPINDNVGPAVNISGVASFGTATFSPTGRALDVFEAVDTVTLQRGAHLLKAGADLLYNRVTVTFPGALQGAYTFTSLANFQRGVYSQYQQAFGTTSQFQSNPNLGLFAQDEWHLRHDLTVNAGLRYDLQWLPAPIRLDANNLSPRLGMAYAPGDGTFVIRASGGLYFDRIPLRATSNALQRDGTRYQVAQLSFGQAAASPAFPDVLSSFPPGLLITTTTIDPGIEAGLGRQASVEVERAIGRTLSATVGYNHLRGTGIIMQRNVNVPTLTAAEAAAQNVPNLGRPNPAFANINQYAALGDSWLNGLTVSLATRTAPWGRTRASYTLSKALDDVGNAFFNTPQDNFNILADKGYSDNDQRHRVVVSGTFGDGTSSAVRRALAGFQVGYIFSYGSSMPFNIVTGTDRNNDTTVNDRPEGVERNSGRMPCYSDVTATCGAATFDLRIARTLQLGGRQQLEILGEVFNLFNHVNVVNVNNTFGAGTTPVSTFKQVTAVGDMRQLQLGVRWTF
jgi:hypothetical protein